MNELGTECHSLPARLAHSSEAIQWGQLSGSSCPRGDHFTVECLEILKFSFGIFSKDSCAHTQLMLFEEVRETEKSWPESGRPD